jgi:large subunit ribosomal protein L23
MRSIYNVIKRPVISEKSTALAEIAGRYVFEVATEANKQEIRDAVQSLFNVKVREVRTMTVHGKVKRVGAHTTKRPNWKKALVTLAEGQKIDFFGTSK